MQGFDMQGHNSEVANSLMRAANPIEVFLVACPYLTRRNEATELTQDLCMLSNPTDAAMAPVESRCDVLPQLSI